MGDMLKGKIAVITGAGNGLGRAHALGMAAQGAKVVVNDIGTSAFGEGGNNSAADTVVAIIKKNGGEAVANYDSVAIEEGAKNIIQEIRALEENQPEDTAVLVVYLASETASQINGCIFEVYKGHVGMFEEPPPVKGVVYKDGSFTAEDLARIIPQTLTKGRTIDSLPDVLPTRKYLGMK